MGILSDINRARKKVTKKILNPVVKGVSKITDKILPNELRFLSPYAAGIGTLMLPPGLSPMMRGLYGMGLNTIGQIGADETPVEDISDLNALSIALSGGLGALGSDRVSGAMRRGIETGVPAEAIGATGPAELGMTTRGPGFLQGAENLGREGIASLSDYVTGSREALAGLGKNPGKLFSSADKFAGAKDAAKALGPTASLATGDVAYETAVDLKDEQDRLDAEEAAEIEATTTANESERASLQMTMMRQAGVPEETVEETLEMNGLSEYYTPPASAANGGIIGLKEGGMLNFGGREIDLRGGGFVPIGRKERADDVPARLSKNEFVMTADAVRAAGS
jgi:hypothetical protein